MHGSKGRNGLVREQVVLHLRILREQRHGLGCAWLGLSCHLTIYSRGLGKIRRNVVESHPCYDRDPG